MNRRTFVAAAGAGLTATVGGCLSGADPAGGSEPSDDDDPSDGGNDPDEATDDPSYTVTLENDPLEDVGEFATLEVELVDPYVELDSPAALEATLANTTDETVSVSSGAPWPFGVVWAGPDGDGDPITLWTDAYEEDGHVGTDGKGVDGVNDIGLVEDLGGGESVTETFEIHEETPNLEAGAYEASISCGIEPAGGENEGLEVALSLRVEEGEGESAEENGDEDESVVSEDPRVDEPPYEIEEQEIPGDTEDENDWDDHYLGEHMPTEPSLEFEVLERVRFADHALSAVDGDGDQYAVHVLESEADRDERIDLAEMDESDREPLENVDFDQQVLVVVESGFGSGSVGHRWNRVEESEEGLHCHGYYTQPVEQTADYTSRISTLVVDRPDGDLALVRTSLTVDTETRVHVNSTEGVVSTDTTDE